jgi:hypothetical protein
MFSADKSHDHAHGKSPPQAPIENHNVVLSLSPGLRGMSYPGYRHRLSKLDPEGAARVQARVRLIFTQLPFSVLTPHPKSTLGSACEGLIRVENHLVPTFHRPKNRPENKRIKPNTNRHKPKNFIMGRCPKGLAIRKGQYDVCSSASTVTKAQISQAHSRLFKRFWPPPGGP